MDNKPYVIGLDLGGTNSVFGIVDADAHVIASTSIRTAGQNDISVYMDNCCKALAPLIEKVGGINNIKGMGIGAPNGNWRPTFRGRGLCLLPNCFTKGWEFPWC